MSCWLDAMCSYVTSLSLFLSLSLSLSLSLQVRAAIREHGATVCFLPSPNNPTGTILPNEDAASILEEDCLLVVDEACVGHHALRAMRAPWGQ